MFEIGTTLDKHVPKAMITWDRLVCHHPVTDVSLRNIVGAERGRTTRYTIVLPIEATLECERESVKVGEIKELEGDVLCLSVVGVDEENGMRT